MPEPTDHRAEAESWLRVAEVEYARAKADPIVTMAALIGIGHALLALNGQLSRIRPQRPNEVPPDVAEAFHRRMEADQSEVRFPVDISDLTQR